MKVENRKTARNFRDGSLSKGARLNAEVWWPGREYERPNAALMPDWLISRRQIFSRWDGGPIETCKAMLSGWPYFSPPWPDVIDATTRWYETSTLEFAEKMGCNFLWLTFSVGFSNERESYQWQLLRPYVEECHKRGIRVAAYMSSCNLFVDDMLATVQESKDWLLLDESDCPVPYGWASYNRAGRVTRMLADITHPGWKKYLKRRIDAAIDLGFDAIEYDNTHWATNGKAAQALFTLFLEKNGFIDTPETRYVFEIGVMERLFLELLEYARGRKADVVMFCNINWPLYPIQRGCSIISTEDGTEPGYYSYEFRNEIDSPDNQVPALDDRPTDGLHEPFDSGRLITNIGLLRALRGLSEGWKPVLVEFGGRRYGHRLLNSHPPLSSQLAIAECNATLCSLQGYQEGLALRDLHQRRPEVMKIAEAIGEANAFVKGHAEHFVGAEYKADVAVVTDDRLNVLKGDSLCETWLTRLARENIQFEVVYADQVSRDTLDRFQCVVAYDVKIISDDAFEQLRTYAGEGGRLAVFGDTGKMDRMGQPRAISPFDSEGPWMAAANESELFGFIEANTSPVFAVPNSPYVLFTATQSAGPAPKTVIHLLNYVKKPLNYVQVHCRNSGSLRLSSLTPGCSGLERVNANTWIIPKLGVYSLLICEP